MRESIYEILRFWLDKGIEDYQDIETRHIYQQCPGDCFIPIGGEVVVKNYKRIVEKNGVWQLKPYQALVCRLTDQ